ncbi:MAG: hypothetical protein ACLGIN_17160 [Candidatus Sericytochromatia bacterium]
MTHRILPLVALASLLAAGCGTLPVVGASAEGEALALRHGGFEGGKAAFAHRGPKGGAFLFPGVELTAEQQSRMQALLEQYRPAAPAEGEHEARHAERQAQAEALEAALTAEPFDAAALEAALTPPSDAMPPQHDPQLLVEARALLTDEQRAQAIARLQEAPADRPEREKPDMTARLAEKLGLTEAQQAALEVVEAARPARDPDAKRQAMIAFLETGDASALAAEAPPAPPAAAIVAFVGTLDASQRAQLAEGPFLGGGQPGFGGPGGHGGKHGFGGKPGFGHR